MAPPKNKYRFIPFLFLAALIAVVMQVAHHPQPGETQKTANATQPTRVVQNKVPPLPEEKHKNTRRQARTRTKPSENPEDFYQQLDDNEKFMLFASCIQVEKNASGKQSFRIEYRGFLQDGEEDTLLPVQKQALHRLRAKCERLHGLEQRLYTDIKNHGTPSLQQGRRLMQQVVRNLQENPETARKLFLQILNSDDVSLRYAAMSYFHSEDKQTQQLLREQLLAPINQQLGLAYFHPQYNHGLSLLDTASKLAACQRQHSCGADSWVMSNMCLADSQLCGLDKYAFTTLFTSPADMDYVDQYLQFLLSQPPLPPDWPMSWLSEENPPARPQTENTAISVPDNHGEGDTP